MGVALAAVADHGHLAGEQVDVAFAVDRGHRVLLVVSSVSGGRAGGAARFAASAARREPDPAGADELLDAVRADELLERVDLLGRADDLEDERVGAEVGDARVEDLAERHQLGAPARAARRP